MSEKRRFTHTTFDNNDYFHDRRLSDLLPTEFIRQFGYDPEQYLFKADPQSKSRRRTDPVVLYFDPAPILNRRFSNIEDSQNNESSHLKPKQFFIVKLLDCTVYAFSTEDYHRKITSVIVRDGYYLRAGLVEKKVDEREVGDISKALEIVNYNYCDPSTQSLFDFIRNQNSVAAAVTPQIMRELSCETEFVSAETVSYQGRSLIRIKVSKADDPSLHAVIQKLIIVFETPIEVFDDYI